MKALVQTDANSSSFPRKRESRFFFIEPKNGGVLGEANRGKTAMKKILAATLALLLTAQAPPPTAVADLAWLSGQWQTADGITEESWTVPRGGMMLGVGRTTRDGVVREFEFLRLQAGADGVPVYWGAPNGATPVGFRLTQAGPSTATFDNPAHDFPQRIRYRREGEALVATISAIDGTHSMSWTYRRQ